MACLEIVAGFHSRESFPLPNEAFVGRHPAVLVKGKSQAVTMYSIRAIYDCRQGEWALALPCQVLNVLGNAQGHGILIGNNPGAPGHGLAFNTAMSLTPGDTLTLRWAMPEYDEPLLLTTLVTACTTIPQEGACSYSQALLTIIDGAAATAFLTPGSCLTATQTWRPSRA